MSNYPFSFFNGIKRISYSSLGALRLLNCMISERRFKNLYAREKIEIESQLSLISTEQIARLNVHHFASNILSFVESMRMKSYAYGRYTFSKKTSFPVLYSSIYAVLIKSLLGEIDNLSPSEREEWISYIKEFQCSDGLFRDESIRIKSSETCDFQCGWRHLTLHAIMALSALGTTADKEFFIIKSMRNENRLTQYLASLPWNYKPVIASNAVQNIGTILQYARDKQNDIRAQGLIDLLFNWLNSNQNPKTGSWGVTLSGRRGTSEQVHTGYHIWLLYFYDKIDIRYKESIIDLLLETRSQIGSFGPFPASSACDDIDTIDPLVRLSKITDYRKDEVLNVLRTAVTWVLFNQNDDGGFVFERNKPLLYGHQYLIAEKNMSSLFPTWFRVLSLGFLAHKFTDYTFLSQEWRFLRCPGHQFL